MSGSSTSSQPISDFLISRIEAGDFPSAVYLVAQDDEIVLHEALGRAVVEPQVIAATTSTIYDLASLTKVLVTTLLVGMLIETGELSLEDQASNLLPEFGTGEKAEIDIAGLLTHTSGLPAWLPLYLIADEPDNVVAAIDGVPLANVGSVVYSDLNFIILGKIVERLAGQSLDSAAAMIFESLDLESAVFNPDISWRPRIAACEHGNRFEEQTCRDQFPDLYANHPYQFRTETIWGSVHDGNSHFMGGVSGHAGLFANAADVFAIARQFLSGTSTFFSPEMCKLLRTNFTKDGSEHRSLGFQLASTPESTAGGLMARSSFGHLGFTGTSVWIDPVRERIFILLTNRTHHRELPFENINSVRRRFHDLAIAHLNEIDSNDSRA